MGPRRFTFAGAGVLKFAAGSPPLAQDLEKVEAAANEKIAEDSDILEFSMDRQEAEAHFGTGIYDLTPAPEAGALLKIVRIPEWEASFCLRPHAESAGSIGAIRIDGADYDDRAKELTLRFHLT